MPTNPSLAPDAAAVCRRIGLIGNSPAHRRMMDELCRYASVRATVLLEGATGTGKELAARALHYLGERRGGPFVPVDCGALPETLFEGEVFGHARGAFTDARRDMRGLIAQAEGGTLFIDEIHTLAPRSQAALLRFLQDHRYRSLGSEHWVAADVRVVAATNRSLQQGVSDGWFRADLYYRLNVLSVYLPPLRERKDDVPLLVRTFVRDLSRLHDRPFHGISAEAMQILQDYSWPGNVRELRNLIESMVVLAPGREVQAADIPLSIREGRAGIRLLPVRVPQVVQGGVEGGLGGRELEFILRSLVELKLQVEELRRRLDEERLRRAEWASEVTAAPGAPGLEPGLEAALSGGLGPSEVPPPVNSVVLRAGMSMADIERLAIEATLRETRGNRRRAAELLGIGERTLYRKLREYQPDLDDGEFA